MQIFRVFLEFDDSTRSQIKLPKEDSHHLVNVLRLKIGSIFEVVNLKDNKVYKATLIEINKEYFAEVLEEISISLPSKNISIIFSICKGDKNEVMLEKCTELGVNSFIFYKSDKSETNLNSNKIERLKKIAYSAACQSKRNSIPKIFFIESKADLENIINFDFQDSLKLICSLIDKSQKISRDKKYILIAIGPEGDFSGVEYDFFKKLNFMPISLGNNILRSETAAICAVAKLSDDYLC